VTSTTPPVDVPDRATFEPEVPLDAPMPDAAPAPAAPPKITAAFTVAPRVGSTPPVLDVVLHNPTPTPIAITRFDDAACFAHYQLSITLTDPAGKPRGVRPCAVTAWPGIVAELAPNGDLAIELPFAKLFAGRWPRGVYQLDVDWDPSALDEARPGTAVSATQSSLANAPFAIARPLATFRIARGKSVNLPGGVRLRFLGHGHKHVAAGGPSSPLIVNTELVRGRGQPVEASANVQLEDTRLFELDGLMFELVAHDYDAWMQLRYFGKLALDD